MQVHTWFRPVLSRTLSVVFVVGLFFIGSTGMASAATPQDEGSVTSEFHSIGGVSVTTIAWVLAGILFLVVGLVAASKSGKRSGPHVGEHDPLATASGSDQSELGQAALAI
jgi:heme/copper-type cytochrome/quinol oxidase subunit 2